jgi:hypothetical protein
VVLPCIAWLRRYAWRRDIAVCVKMIACDVLHTQDLSSWNMTVAFNPTVA